MNQTGLCPIEASEEDESESENLNGTAVHLKVLFSSCSGAVY